MMTMPLLSIHILSNPLTPTYPYFALRPCRVYKNAFDPSSIGDFLGEGGTTHDEEIYRSQIRFRYTRAISFVELEVEPALRL